MCKHKWVAVFEDNISRKIALWFCLYCKKEVLKKPRSYITVVRLSDLYENTKKAK